MKEYEEGTLKKLQGFELKIYGEFARVCEKHGLTFFVGYGTTLGAIRHKGFIPWDDDMDVCMPRDDYEKFVQVAPEELAPPFELLEVRRTDGYVMPFAKVTNASTTFIELTDQDRKYKSGIFIDIFPLDTATLDAKKRRRAIKRSWLTARLCVLSTYSKPKLPAGINPVSAFVSRAACGAVYVFLKLLGISKAKLYDRYMKAVRSARDDESGEYTDFVFAAQSGVFHPKDELFPTVMTEFEGIEVPVPNDPDTYLTKNYGNYMELPPVEKRHAHYPAVLNFDE